MIGVGQTPTYSIDSAFPNQPILWWSYKNGVAIESGTSLGVTDAFGKATIPYPTWTSSDIALWNRQARVGGFYTNSISYGVSQLPVTVFVDDVVTDGRAPIYRIVNGEPNSPVTWSLTFNGSSVNRNGPTTTDGSGRVSYSASPWTAADIGRWTVQVTINGVTSNQLTFDVSSVVVATVPAISQAGLLALALSLVGLGMMLSRSRSAKAPAAKQ